MTTTIIFIVLLVMNCGKKKLFICDMFVSVSVGWKMTCVIS